MERDAGDSEPVLERRAIRLPDGRRLVFYEFPAPARRAPPARPDPAPAADRPAREEP